MKTPVMKYKQKVTSLPKYTFVQSSSDIPIKSLINIKSMVPKIFKSLYLLVSFMQACRAIIAKIIINENM